jgi:protein SCO1
MQNANDACDHATGQKASRFSPHRVGPRNICILNFAFCISSATRFTAVTFCILHFAFCVSVIAQQGPGGVIAEKPGTTSTSVPPALRDVTFEQRLNTRLPLDARFRDESGRDVALGDFFGRKPVVLAFVYYSCPMLCTQVLNGVSGAVKALPFTVGADFDVVYVSFDPRDTPQAAAEKKQAQLADYKQGATAAGWHYLTGDEASIRRLTSAAGFSYRWDEASGQFAHVSGLLVVTPDGRLSRYFYGIEYSPKELRMAIVESGEGRIGSAVDKLLLYCYHYDPATGRYGVIAMNLVRLGGAITLVLLGGFVWLMRRREKRPGPGGSTAYPSLVPDPSLGPDRSLARDPSHLTP